MVLLRPATVTAAPPAASSGFFDYPTQPGYAQHVEFEFMIGKPMTVAPNTMICVSPADILAFWNSYDQAISIGRDDLRRQAVTTALAASCKITQSTTFGTIVADEQPSPASPEEWIVFKSNDDGNNYWVQSESVSP